MSTRRAFTLVEMMVALGVTSVLTVLMLRMFMDSSAIWKQHEERLDTFREARAGLQLMARELGTVAPVPDVPEKFPVLSLRSHPSSAALNRVNQEIYALATAPNTGRSDLCAIGYYCEWDPAKSAFALRRQFVDSNETFLRLRKTLDPTSGFIIAPTPNDSRNPGQRATFQDNGELAFKTLYSRSAPADSQAVATYVWDLEFIALATVIDPNTKLPVVDSSTSLPKTAEAKWPQGPFSNDLPLWLEIRFKALGSSAARKLAGQAVAPETWFDQNSTTYQRLILPGVQQFVTRVKLTR